MATTNICRLRSEIRSADCSIVARAAHELASNETHLRDEELSRTRACLAETHGLASGGLTHDYLRILGGASGPREAARLLRLSPDQEVRHEAFCSLIDFGEAATPVLRELAHHPDDTIRCRAYDAARIIGGGDAIALLVEGLADPDVGVRWVASNVLVAAGEGALVPVLRALVDREPTTSFHRAAARELRRCRPLGLDDEVRFLVRSLDRQTSVYEASTLAYELLFDLTNAPAGTSTAG